MTLIARLRSIAAGLMRRERIESSMNDEIRFHIEAYRDDLIKSGVPRSEAERRARIEFGGVETVRDECRQARGLRWLDDLRGDLRFGGRMLRRNPAFAAIAVLSLALGIGANTAIFTLVDTVLLKSLPVTQPDRLFFIDNSGGKSGGGNGPPYPCYETLRDHNRYFSGLAAFSAERFKVTIDGSQEQIVGQYASGSYFQVLGVSARYGRVLTPLDDSQIGRGGPDGAAVVISYALWKRRFAMSPAVLGKTIQVGTKWVTIVGVTPPGFFGLEVGSPVDLTIPMTLVGNALQEKQSWWFSVVGRLKDGAMPEQARADLDRMFQTYMSEIGMQGDARSYFDRIALVPANKGLNELRRRFSKPLLIVMTIVGLILLIGCANVANLLLARATARQNEISVRLAIGAGRGRLIRQLLTEGLLLVTLGASAGVIFARWGVSVLVGFLAGVQSRILLEPHFDLRILGFTAAVAGLTGLLFSLAPALHVARVDVAKPGEAARMSMAKPRLRLGRSLVIVQVMLSLVLICGAGLFVRTLYNLNTLDAGFRREGVLIMRVDATLPETADDRAQTGRMWEGFIARVSAIPGVKSAGAATLSPMSGRDRGVLIEVAGGPTRSESDQGIHLNQVTPEYFETFGIRLLAGRWFTPRDRSNSLKVAILNDNAARFYFGDGNPIGARVRFPRQLVTDTYEVIGIAGDTRYESLRNPAERMVYLPMMQPVDRITGVMLALRSSLDTGSLMPAIRNDVRLAVPGGFVTDVLSVDQQVAEALVQERLVAMLASFFGALALILACIGLYGVMSYAVVRRTREIGIRMALGAQRNSVVWLVLRETLVLIAIGLTLGIPVVLSVTRYIKSELFGLEPADPIALFGAIIVLLSVAALAGYAPARRASRVEPVIALRYE